MHTTTLESAHIRVLGSLFSGRSSRQVLTRLHLHLVTITEVLPTWHRTGAPHSVHHQFLGT